ncbi:MAG TPA: purine-nucleoside phosphorylase [Acidobacteriota bacterium]|nr:purine-nucleoside phosphorylase [Acidobacteriota bacterium]
MYERIEETVAAILERHPQRPCLGLILGSGLGAYAETLRGKSVIPFHELPHFPCSTAPGHSGNLVLGEAEGVSVVALQGRVHFYEGYSMAEVAYPTRVLGGLGIHQLIVTNAAGAINVGFRPGDLMLIADHINLMGSNPLIGRNIDELGPRFPDMSKAYDSGMRDAARRTAADRNIALREGVYLGLAGPSYETPAEIRMFRTLGADAVGMSTVPEVVVANHMGIRVLGISCITNMAAGIIPQRLTHQEVMDTTERVKEQFISLLRGIIPALPGMEEKGTTAQ